MGKFSFEKICIAGFVSLAASACQSQHSEAGSPASAISPARVEQQLIIKFKSHTIACSAPALARFSAEIHIALQYIRPMSGDACVVKQTAAHQAGLLEGQRILKNHLAVDWLEEDRNMKAFR